MNVNGHEVRFYGVRKYGTRSPVVHTSVDGVPVIWDERGWRCGFRCPDLNACPHIDLVEDLLAPQVVGDWYRDAAEVPVQRMARA